MQTLETKISAHFAETPDTVMNLKAELDAVHEKLEVVHCNKFTVLICSGSWNLVLVLAAPVVQWLAH